MPKSEDPFAQPQQLEAHHEIVALFGPVLPMADNSPSYCDTELTFSQRQDAFFARDAAAYTLGKAVLDGQHEPVIAVLSDIVSEHGVAIGYGVAHSLLRIVATNNQLSLDEVTPLTSFAQSLLTEDAESNEPGRRVFTPDDHESMTLLLARISVDTLFAAGDEEEIVRTTPVDAPARQSLRQAKRVFGSFESPRPGASDNLSLPKKEFFERALDSTSQFDKTTESNTAHDELLLEYLLERLDSKRITEARDIVSSHPARTAKGKKRSRLFRDMSVHASAENVYTQHGTEEALNYVAKNKAKTRKGRALLRAFRKRIKSAE